MSMAELKATKPVKWWHEAIIEDMLAFPTDTLEARGKRLNYSASYLCIIINTDMFKVAYEKRKNEFRSNMDEAVINKATNVAVKGLDLMLEIMDTKRTQIPFGTLTDTVDKTLTRLGYGVEKKAPAVQLNVQGSNVAILPTVTAEQLTAARSALRAVEQERALAPPEPPRERREGAEHVGKTIDGVLLPEPGES
jgi:hypothetical protein